ncbi:exopolyphosphatase PRUNE1 isoform X1 [Frankliniella occidentalis]|uniref:Exopolyphosphatase PRUNE1 isoform X1 n=2 Tax=Frankliniella occidentalis TaxID=133901 RepID=A0A6J1SDK4_FRAOC|nr:exopolyphosphatase PRUNE1 isoform X1 [Frankliniella occidentalis]
MPDTALFDFMRKAKDASTHLCAPLGSNKNIHIIMGNESCDLDSVVSALCFGLYQDSPDKIVIPLLNIENDEFPLRTEVTYLLHENGVPSNLLVFRDQIDLAALRDSGRLRLTLVDHHALPERDRALADSLVAVIDHRPLDVEASRAFPPGMDLDVRTVGSCASLVAERILRQAPHLLDAQVANLIRGTVLLDTACFSPQADRTTPVDVAAVEACESVSNTEDRATTFDRIVCARKDVSSLSSFQILHKDMKVVRGVPLPGMPLLVHDFLKRPDVGSALSEFCTKHASAAAVVIGMSFSESSGTSSLRRDLAVYSLGGAEQPAGQLIEALRAEEDLQLSPAPCSIPGVTLFDQRNAKLSRKQILPVVQRVLSAATARA